MGHHNDSFCDSSKALALRNAVLQIGIEQLLAVVVVRFIARVGTAHRIVHLHLFGFCCFRRLSFSCFNHSSALDLRNKGHVGLAKISIGRPLFLRSSQSSRQYPPRAKAVSLYCSFTFLSPCLTRSIVNPIVLSAPLASSMVWSKLIE